MKILEIHKTRNKIMIKIKKLITKIKKRNNRMLIIEMIIKNLI